MNDPNIGRIVVAEHELQQRIRDLGKEITADYVDGPPLLVGILKGAFMFMADLARAIDRVPGLRRAAEEATSVDSSDQAELVSACELLLEGLHAKRLISRSEQLGYTRAQSERTERRSGSRSWSESSGIN